MAKTTRPMVRIHNLETDEIIDREMNDEEYQSHIAQLAAYESEQNQLAEKMAARQAILDRLGLTEEEARLLLG